MLDDLTGLVAVMAPFMMVVGIVWIKSRNKLEEKRLSATASLSAEKAAQYASHTAELEERVRVLERIVTDKGYDVASQIEALRDTRKVDALLGNHGKELR
jgi:ABC-type phosphate transport system auxiliary subunit